MGQAVSGLVAGLDVSGCPRQQNLYLAVVIGVDTYIRSLVESLGYKQIHMSGMPRKVRRSILSRLEFRSKECAVLCVKIDRDLIVDKIVKMKKTKNSYAATRRVLRAYNRLLLKELRGRIQHFLAAHRHALSDVVFQCDGDCVDFAKDVGLRHAYVTHVRDGDAHALADIVAWANNKGMEPKSVTRLDVTDRIGTRLRNSVLK